MTLTETTMMNGGPDFEVGSVADLGSLAPIRREAARRLAAQGVASEDVDDVVLVLCELCTNAIQATDPIDAPIRVRVRFGDAAIVLEVQNSGPSFDTPDTSPAGDSGADTEGNRGLAIVRALSDDISVHFHGGRCLVRATIATRSRSSGSPG